MIEKMTRYDWILLSSERDGFLEELRSLGVVDISRSSKPVDGRSAEMLASIEEKKKLLRELEKGEDATLAAMRRKIGELEAERALVEPWGHYDSARLAPFNPHFYCESARRFDETLSERYPLQEVSRDGKKVWFVVLGSELPEGLKELPAPERTLGEVDAALAMEKENAAAYEAELGGRKSEIPALQAAIDGQTADLNLYLASLEGTPAADDALCIYEGFAPSADRDSLEKAFAAMDGVLVLQSEATVEDAPPIKLKNNWFVRQFELLTDMYGRPGYNEFDPTPYISVFFMLFFAMCMGDAGYGLLLVVIGLLLRKAKGLGGIAPLVVILGTATFLTGIVMHTFFGVDISVLPWVPSWLKAVMVTGTIAGFEAQMVLSLAIGVVHLCLAMVVKTVYATRNRGFLGSLGVWGWTLLIVGGVIVAAVALFGLVPPAVTRWTVIALGVLSALGIFLFNDIRRSPLKNIGSGLWETYNTVTGLLGDVLSYLRLYALGLAGGMLGKAFNDIAVMTLGDGSPGPGWLAFALILIIGHALNLAMCCLGAFVHPLRLNFLEFFKNSGYEGKGKAYTPLK